MGKLIKIPKEVAVVGKISYIIDGRNCEIEFNNEQKDGSFLMDENVYFSVKDIPEVKLAFRDIDFESFARITIDQIDNKEL